jgi:hypothetical protein
MQRFCAGQAARIAGAARLPSDPAPFGARRRGCRARPFRSRLRSGREAATKPEREWSDSSPRVRTA